jgi:hypothetical protein
VAARRRCTVTVVITDENGNPEPGLHPRKRPCLPGQTDGGTDFYNPYTNTHRFEPEPPLPLEGLDPANDKKTGSTATHGSSTSAGTGTPSSGCTPTASGGTKAGSKIKQQAQPTCPASSSPGSALTQ